MRTRFGYRRRARLDRADLQRLRHSALRVANAECRCPVVAVATIVARLKFGRYWRNNRIGDSKIGKSRSPVTLSIPRMLTYRAYKAGWKVPPLLRLRCWVASSDVPFSFRDCSGCELRGCRKCVQVDAAFRASVRYITF
jgi:hypothetical protein